MGLVPWPQVTTRGRITASLRASLVNTASVHETLYRWIAGQPVFAPFLVHWFHSPQVPSQYTTRRPSLSNPIPRN